MRFLGNVLRAEELEKDCSCLLGGIEGYQERRGRQRMTYLDSFLINLGDNYRVAQLVALAWDRERWRSMIAI